jgi:hypothetical protein
MATSDTSARQMSERRERSGEQVGVVDDVRRQVMRIIRIFALGAFCLCVAPALIGTIPAGARPHDSVTFQRRSYDVRIARNGDVSVRERWDATFAGGPFQSATLGVYLAHTTGVDFGAVEGATAGSEKVADVEDKAVSRVRQLTWSFPAANDESRAFTIPYTLHGALGFNAGKAWLDWHFLDGFGRSIIPATAVAITIGPPAGLSAGDVQAQAVYPGVTLTPAVGANGAVTISGQTLSSGESLEALVTFPRSALDPSLKRPYWQRSDMPPTLPTPLGDVSSQPNASAQNDFWAGLLSNFGLVIGVGLAIAALMIAVAWWLTRRLRRNIKELTQSMSEKDDSEGYSTGELPAINLNFDEISLPPPAEQPEIEGLDFSSSGLSDIVFDDEVATNDPTAQRTPTNSE